MKKNIIALSILTLLSTTVFAQEMKLPGNFQVSQQMGATNMNSGMGTSVPNISINENQFEKNTVPFLKQYAEKKSQLELIKLDKEIQKMKDEEIKANLDRERLLSVPQENNQKKEQIENLKLELEMVKLNKEIQIEKNVPITSAVQENKPNDDTRYNDIMKELSALKDARNKDSMSVENKGPELRVVMVVGFENKLSAKVALGNQGGYIVKKGDVLPDGRLVKDVKQNFIIVSKKATTDKVGEEKIFVTGNVSNDEKEGSSNSSNGGNINSVATSNIVKPTNAPQGFLAVQELNSKGNNTANGTQSQMPFILPGMR